jgi:hypothetical protein
MIWDAGSFNRLTEDLGERTLGILQRAGVLPGGQRKKRTNLLRKPKHVLFVAPESKQRPKELDGGSGSSSSPAEESFTASNLAEVNLGWTDSLTPVTPRLNLPSNQSTEPLKETWVTCTCSISYSEFSDVALYRNIAWTF